MGRRAAELLGVQTPTHRLAPPGDFSRGPEAIALADIVGLTLDQYQKDLLVDGCMVTGDKWTSPEVGLELSRQNGKSLILYARALAGLFLFGSRLIIYSAHKGEAAMEAFGIIEDLIMSTPELKREVAGRPSRTNGKEQIRLVTGQRIKFRTRTTGGGRSLSGDDVFVDECQDADDADLAALLPTTLARPNSQIWYAGSAGGQNSTVQGRLVQRCTDASPGLTYYRWAGSEDDDPADPRTWARLNPAVGRRMDIEKLAMAQRSLAADKFAQEHMGIGDYPRPEGEDWVIPRSAYERTIDTDSRMSGPVVFAVDVRPNRDWAALAVAGRRRDGMRHVEVVQYERGSRWVTPRMLTLLAKNPHLGVVIDPTIANREVITELQDAGVKVTTTTARDMALACADLHDSITGDPSATRHRGEPVLAAALASASTRKLLDGWAWRRTGSADISPLVAATKAHYGVRMLSRHRAGPPQTPLPARSERIGRARLEQDLATASF